MPYTPNIDAIVSHLSARRDAHLLATYYSRRLRFDAAVLVLRNGTRTPFELYTLNSPDQGARSGSTTET